MIDFSIVTRSTLDMWINKISWLYLLILIKNNRLSFFNWGLQESYVCLILSCMFLLREKPLFLAWWAIKKAEH